MLTPDGEPEDAALRGLVADELAIQLAAHQSVDLISRMSARRAGGNALEPAVERLGATYVVAGACYAAGGRVRLNIELIFVADQRVVWSGSLDEDREAIVRNPASRLESLRAALLAAVEAHETGRVRSLPLASLESYALLIGGVRLMHRLSRSDFERARAAFEQLVERHPRHPDGFAWLAKWHILQVHQGWSADTRASTQMAGDMSRRALDQDDRCGLAMVISGMVQTFGERRLDAAERLYAEALAAHPNEPLAWLLKGMVHAFRGEGDVAVAHTERASMLSPLDPMRYYFDSLGASAHAAAGHYDTAVTLAERSLAANALHASSLRILTIAHAMRDDIVQSRAAAARLLALEPDFTVERFLARSPSAAFAIGREFAGALRRSGIPAGPS